MDFLRTIVGRVIAGPLAIAIGFLVENGIIPESAGAEWETAVVGAVVLAAYGAFHKLFDRFVNPADDARA